MLDTLIVDAAPLLTGTTAAITPLAKHFVTTSQVRAEVRDKTSRDLLENSQLPLTVREPSAESVVQVTNFARQTGDLAVLSQADIRLCALALTLELQLRGADHVRPGLGKLSPAETRQKARSDARRERRHAKKAARQAAAEQSQDAKTGEKKAASAKKQAVEEDAGEWQQVGTSSSKQKKAAESESDDDSDGDDWITPENIAVHKMRNLGLNPSAPVDVDAESENKVEGCACLTGDFAMQNVLMQMGLKALGPNGLEVKQVKTWVLRCHACFKICKNPVQKFCPSCGNATLIRTSITYLPAPTAEHPQGYILHLKKNFQYRNRGTIFSLPSVLSSAGASKGPKQDVLILRPDQKEYLRGMKSYEVSQRKEERRARRELEEGRVDEDWIAPMELGEKGRKSHQTTSVRTDKRGMPIVGMGAKNPNVVGRKKV